MNKALNYININNNLYKNKERNKTYLSLTPYIVLMGTSIRYVTNKVYYLNNINASISTTIVY